MRASAIASASDRARAPPGMRPDSRRPPEAPDAAARPGAKRAGVKGPTYSPGSSTSERRPLSSRFGSPRRSHISLRCEYFATAATVCRRCGRAPPASSPPPPPLPLPPAGASMRRYPDSVLSIGPNTAASSPPPPPPSAPASPSSRYRASVGGPPPRCLSAMSSAIAGVASEPSTNTTSCGASDASCTSMAAMTALAATGLASSWARLSTWTKWRGRGHRRAAGPAGRRASRPSTATAPIATMSVASMRSAQCEPSTPAVEGGGSGPGRSESRPSSGASVSRTELRIDLIEEMSAARPPASRRDEASISRTIACGRSANGASAPAPAT